MKSRRFTLIEVAIVMVLAAILIGTLFYAQMDAILTGAKIEKVHTVIMGRERFFFRLSQILHSETDFSVEENRLVLKYDNGVDYERPFCGFVTSLLYLDKGKICLATWPKEGQGRVETLLEGVESFSFVFFDEETNEWSNSIPKDRFKMCKIVVDKVEFPFFLT